MEFLFLIQNISLEIIILILSILLLIVFLIRYIYHEAYRVISAFTPQPITRSPLIKIPEMTANTIGDETPVITPDVADEDNISKTEDRNIITPMEMTEKVDTSQVEKLVGLVSSARTLIARGMLIEARALIIEGLSIEKTHRELNLLLGQIYEQEGQYPSAEYVYKDLAELHPNDIEILEKLANVLIIEKKYMIAREIYKKIHSINGNTETTLYMLTHLSNTLSEPAPTLEYSRQYVLQWPKNPEIIEILASTQVSLGLRREAIESYKLLKNLTPYSTEITEILQKLMLEEELANNFEVKEG